MSSNHTVTIGATTMLTAAGQVSSPGTSAVAASFALAAAGVVDGDPPTGRDITIHTGAASYTRIIPGPTARRTIHPGRTL